MIVLVLATAAAAGWGAADFLGGQSSHRGSVFSVIAVTEAIGVVVVAPMALAAGAPHWSGRLLLAAVAGLSVTVELSVIYDALRAGAAFITAPVGALGAALAVSAGIASGDPVTPGTAVGLTCAILGGGLGGDGDGRGQLGPLRSIAACLLASAAVCTTQVTLHAAGAVDPFWATGVEHLSTALSAGLVAAFMAARRRRGRLVSPGRGRRARSRPAPVRRWPRMLDRDRLLAFALNAATGTGGDLAFAGAAHGPLSTVSAVSSLYPIPTILLGAALQGRRPRRRQAAGVVLALAGSALLGALAP